MAKNKSQYDSTLNLPKTLFEMRAGLPKKEPVMLKDCNTAVVPDMWYIMALDVPLTA